MVNQYKLKELVESTKGASVDVATIIGEAKAKMKKSEYKDLIEMSGLSKDSVSLALKRFRMIELGFNKEFIQDCTDREVKKITHKMADVIEAITLARKELAAGDISYVDFCEEFDRHKVVKTDNEKLISKAEGVVKFLEKAEINDETLTDVANMFQPLVEQWSLPK